MKKRLIYQVSVGNPPPFYETCTNSVKEYCERNGFEYYKQVEPIIKLRPVNSHRSERAVERFGYLPHFEKANAFDSYWMNSFDQIAIIDADIYIREDAPNIFDELNGGHVVGAVLECDMPLTPEFVGKVKEYSIGQYGMFKEMERRGGGIPFFNTGVLVFNCENFKPYLNGDSPEQFVKRKEFEKFVNGEGKWKWASDQTPLNWWFQKEKMNTKHLSWKWNGLYKGIPADKIAEVYFIHFFLATKLQKQGVDINKVIDTLK